MVGREAAPELRARGIGLRFRIGPNAFGNALGDSLASVNSSSGSSVGGSSASGGPEEPALGQTFAEDVAARKAANYWNPAQDRPVLVADSGQFMTDAGSPYGDVNFGEPVKPNATSDAVFNALVEGMQNPRPVAGPRIMLDDFGNPVSDQGGGGDLNQSDIDRENYLLASRTHTISANSPSGILVRDGKPYYRIMQDPNGLGIYQNSAGGTISSVAAGTGALPISPVEPFVGTAGPTVFAGKQELWEQLNQQYGTGVDFSALTRFEGGQLLDGYVPKSNGKVLGRSGVTIATGFDIGQMNATQLDRLGMPQYLANKLRPYAGLIKGDAVDFLASNPLLVTRSEAMQIDFAVKGAHLRSAIQSWNNSDPTVMFTDLTQAQQTVIFSRTFHQGVGMPNTRQAQDFYGAATQGRWLDAEVSLRNYPVRENWYKNRVGLEADLLLKERNR